MGQKTNPIGNRLGIIRGWDSNWYGGRKFDAKLVEDDKIRSRYSKDIHRENFEAYHCYYKYCETRLYYW